MPITLGKSEFHIATDRKPGGPVASSPVSLGDDSPIRLLVRGAEIKRLEQAEGCRRRHLHDLFGNGLIFPNFYHPSAVLANLIAA
jgi:hypothetical protein